MRFIFVALILLLVGCASKPTDYGSYLDHMPKSIVVLPPLNQSTEVHASDAFLATITFPLAERGYYIFPVAMVDHYMKENGLPTPGEMHQVSPQKFGEILGADAVLYIVIKEWTTTYIILDSSTKVTLEYRLVDTKTGTELWRREQTVVDSSSNGQSSLGGMIISAAFHAGTSAAQERMVANQASFLLINDRDHGMLVGPRNPEFEKDQKYRVEERIKLNKAG